MRAMLISDIPMFGDGVSATPLLIEAFTVEHRPAWDVDGRISGSTLITVSAWVLGLSRPWTGGAVMLPDPAEVEQFTRQVRASS